MNIKKHKDGFERDLEAGVTPSISSLLESDLLKHGADIGTVETKGLFEH